MPPNDLELYRTLIEHGPTLVWRAGLDAKCDYFNATWLAFTGRALRDELGDGWIEGVHPDDRASCGALYLAHFARRQNFEMEYRLRRHDGVYRWVLDRGVPFVDAAGAFAGFIGSCVDVDDRRREAAASGAAEFFEMSLDNLCVAGFDGYFKRLNPAWTRSLGWTPEELMARPSVEFVHPDDRGAVLAARHHLTEGVPLLGLVNRYRCKDGSYRWLEWRSIAHTDRSLVYAVARDVTEERLAQRALRDLTESLTTTLNSIADGVIATDADGAVARMNPVAERLTGWRADDALGRPLQEVLHVVDAETRDPAGPPFERTLKEGIAVEFANHTLLLARDGTERPIASSCAPMKDNDGGVRGAVLVFRDMTAEKKGKEVQEQLQRQLIHADRLASVGTLAAGVAHEINNPLA